MTIKDHKVLVMPSKYVGFIVTIVLASLFFQFQALRAENKVPQVTNQVQPKPILTFGSQIILEKLWSPAELQRDSMLIPLNSPPANPNSKTILPPVPAQWRGSIRGVDPLHDRKVVALTFDLCEAAREISGYDAGIVNYLRAQRVKATFFAGGKWLHSHPEKAMQLMADPLFEIGNHSWDHPHFRHLTAKAMKDQILQTQAQYEVLWEELARRARAQGIDPGEMEKITRVPHAFRFPYGTCSPEALGIVARLGLVAIQWDIVTGDPDRHQSAQRIAAVILNRIEPGAIIICHANGRGWWTADALPLFVPKLKALGYEFVTISELLQCGPAVTTMDCRQ
jgi:peptidoglycan/xylan/chitin deacetylase (PgdA/CDA1 family)